VALRLAAADADAVYVGAILVPGDEAVLFCFDAVSAVAVEAAGGRVGLRCDRVVPAIFLDLQT
jgi:hypothetical protein